METSREVFRSYYTMPYINSQTFEHHNAACVNTAEIWELMSVTSWHYNVPGATTLLKNIVELPRVLNEKNSSVFQVATFESQTQDSQLW